MLKLKKFRSKKYLNWVKSQKSPISGMPADDPHHIIGRGQGGASTKASDMFCFPLTRFEHTRLHNIGHKDWEYLYGCQWKYVFETIKKAIKEGFFSIDDVIFEINSQVVNVDDKNFLIKSLEEI